MVGTGGRGHTGLSRRAVVRSAGAGLAGAIPALGGCAAPVVRTSQRTGASDGTSESTDDGDVWGLTVAVGPEGRTVFELGTEIPLQVQPGTTVAFEWRSDGHDIHVESQPDDADWAGHESTEDARFVHEHTFVVVGRYRFFCSRHRDEGMVGEVHVGDCDCGPPTRTTESG